jgi:RNA recognition motif-containing protein
MNIYVANLSYRVQDEDLNEVFAEYGTVTSAKVIKDNFTGKSRGFGFVEMADEKEANEAIEQLEGADLDGKVIAVSKARPKAPNSGGGRSGGNGGGGNYGKPKRY